jgi:hypothetical protein
MRGARTPVYRGEAEVDYSNPFKELREESHLTLRKLGTQVGVGYQAVYLNEQGCYTPPLSKIVDFFINEGLTDLRFHELEVQYRRFQKEKRQYFGTYKYDLCSCSLSDLGAWPAGTTAPFEIFRNNFLKFPRTQVAKDLCVQPATLYRVALGETRRLPYALVEALSEAGLSDRLILELDDRTLDYYS